MTLLNSRQCKMLRILVSWNEGRIPSQRIVDTRTTSLDYREGSFTVVDLPYPISKVL